MENSTLIELFKTLTNKELNSFLSFAESAYFNKGKYRKEGLVLLKILQKAAPVYDSSALQKEKIYKNLFPGSPFAEGKVDQVIVELNKLLRQFLSVERFMREESEHQAQIQLAHVLIERGLVARARQMLNGMLKKLESIKAKNFVDYGKLFEVADLIKLTESYNSNLKDVEHIPKALDYLDRYFHAQRLALLNHYTQTQRISQAEQKIDLQIQGNIFKIFECTEIESADVYLSQVIYTLLSEKSLEPEKFEYLFNLLKKYENDLTSVNLKQYFAYLRIYCTFLINTGENNLYSLLHQIHVDNLQKGYFYHDGKLTKGAYYNISRIARVANEVEWAYSFIIEHKDRILGENENRDIFRLTLADYYCEIGKFEEGLELLPDSFDNIQFVLIQKSLEVKLYYEINSPIFEYRLGAFKMYISRASKRVLSEDSRERYANFVNFLNQIYTSKPGAKDRGETIVRRIQEKEWVAYRDWLIKKARALK